MYGTNSRPRAGTNPSVFGRSNSSPQNIWSFRFGRCAGLQGGRPAQRRCRTFGRSVGRAPVAIDATEPHQVDPPRRQSVAQAPQVPNPVYVASGGDVFRGKSRSRFRTKPGRLCQLRVCVHLPPPAGWALLRLPRCPRRDGGSHQSGQPLWAPTLSRRCCLPSWVRGRWGCRRILGR